MSNVYFLVGIPCSGKTTFREQHFPKTEYIHISSDDIIEKIGTMFGRSYNTIFRDAIKFAQSECIRKAYDAVNGNKLELLPGRQVIWDQTNLTVKSRLSKLGMFPQYRKVAYVFPVPSQEVLAARLEEREKKNYKTVPRAVIDNMIKSIEIPTTAEGFDEIRYYHGGL
jgi:predicted kinase